jgi:GrpB-like predicted nucleotidyltransferase (UPF0157 family)
MMALRHVVDWESEPQAPVEVVPYNSQWVEQFEIERAALEITLAPWLVAVIEHVGSTAIPGMVAKPVIDIMAPVKTLEASLPAIDALAEIGYLYCPYKTEVMHWFCKPSTAQRTHHLHLIPYESPLWFERLGFRDALRNDASLRAQYSELKLRLAIQFRDDREAYTEAKEPFVSQVISGLGAKK